MKEQRKTKAQLFQELEQQKFQHIFKHAIDGILLADLETKRFDVANLTICRMLGYDHDEIRKLRVMDIHPKDDLPYVIEQFERQSRGEISLAENIPVQRKDGSVFFADINSTPVTIGGKEYLLGIFRDLTGRKRIEEALRESEANYREVASNLPGVIYQFCLKSDGTFDIPFVSEGVMDMLGVSAEEVSRDPQVPFAMMLPEYLPKIWESISESAADLSTWNLEFKLKNKKGEIKWLRGGATPRKLPNGDILWNGVFIDLTKRRQAEEELKKTHEKLEQRVDERTAELLQTNEELRNREEWFRSLVLNLSDIILVIDKNMNIRYVSPSVEPILGHPPQAILGENIIPYLHPEDVSTASELFAQTMKKPGASPPFEVRVRHARGSWIYLELIVNNLLDNPGVRGVVINARNIHERKLSEEALRESREMYRTLLRAFPDAIAVTDLQLNISEIAQGNLELFGYDNIGEIPVKSAIEFIHPDDHERAMRNLSRVVEDGTLRNKQYRFYKKDGSTFIGELNAALVRDSGGKPKAFVGTIRDITRRVQAEQELRVSEEKFRTIVENIPLHVGAIDATGKFVIWNRRSESMLGYSQEEAIGNLTPSQIHETEEEARQVVETAGREGVFDGELNFVHKDGRKFPVHLVVIPRLDERGNRNGFFGIAEDVTERKRAATLLRASEERFRSLVETTSDWMWEVDADGVYTYASPKIKDLLGYEPEEVIGKTPFSFMHPDEAERIARQFRAIVESRKPFERLENANFHKDGRRMVLETSGVPIFSSDGTLLGYRGVDRDITERKQAETLLQESEERFRSLVQNSSDMIITLDSGMKITYVSPSVERVLGYRPEEVIGTNANEYFHPEDAQKILANFSSTIESPGSAIPAESRVKKADGSWIYTEGTAINLLDNPAIQGVVINTRDITERKRLERELLEISAREQRRIGQDLHDGLGQHLTGIAFLSKALERKLEPASPAEAKEASKIVTLVNQAITRTRGLARGLCPVGVEASGLMSALREMTANVENVFGISCRFVCDDEVLVYDNTASSHLYQIALEAVNNALKHGKADRITIRLAPENGKITLRVADNGLGIPKKHDGKGLGLHIMSYRASLIDGSLDVALNDGGGTVVTCTFPGEKTP